MRVQINEVRVDHVCRFFEPTNNIASEYFIENMDKFRKIAAKQKISESKVDDLISDVFISLIKSERNGEGFDESRGISVENFISGRISRYAENRIYKSEFIENPLVKREKGKNKKDQYIQVVAASINDEDTDELTSFQAAYMNASIYDSKPADIENTASVEEQLDYLLDICSLHGVAVANILKNIDRIGNLLSSNESYGEGLEILNPLKNLFTEHDEAKDALESVLEYSEKDRDGLMSLLAFKIKAK